MYFRLFAIPIQTKLHFSDLAGLLAPLVMVKQGANLVGFYHIPIAALVMGLGMLLAARRFGVISVFVIATILAFCDALLNVSPIIWASISVLCCSVIAGAGVQGLISASSADRKWVLSAGVVMGILSIITLLFATKYFQILAGFGNEYAKLFLETAEMYILGTIASTVIFFIVRGNFRVHWLRISLLSSAMGVDIFLGAQFVVDNIF